jgi:hypothetical protein
MEFFQIRDDLYEFGRWFLKSPHYKSGENINPWIFSQGEFFEQKGEMIVDFRREGTEIDFTLCAFDVPLVNAKFKNYLLSHFKCDIQFIDVEIRNLTGTYYIMNLISVYPCLNFLESKAVFWKEEDGIPQKTGEVRRVEQLIIDPTKIPSEALLFRVKELENHILCTKKFADEIVLSRLSGIKFESIKTKYAN